MARWRGARRIAAFAILLAAVSAVPVLASEPPVPDLGDVPLPPRSLEAQGDWVPDSEYPC